MCSVVGSAKEWDTTSLGLCWRSSASTSKLNSTMSDSLSVGLAGASERAYSTIFSSLSCSIHGFQNGLAASRAVREPSGIPCLA